MEKSTGIGGIESIPPRKEFIMNNLYKILSILFVFSLVFLPLTGCDNPPWDAGMLLNLKVDSPSNDTSVTTPTVTVSGRVSGSDSSNAKVTVNGTDVPLNDLKFVTDIKLSEGKNVISINAKAGAANLDEQRTVTYTPAK